MGRAWRAAALGLLALVGPSAAAMCSTDLVGSKKCDGMVGEYYANHEHIKKKDFLWRYDTEMAFNWKEWGPQTTVDNFAVRWSGVVKSSFKALVVLCDDSVQVNFKNQDLIGSTGHPYSYRDYPAVVSPKGGFTSGGELWITYKEFYGKASCHIMVSQKEITEDDLEEKWLDPAHRSFHDAPTPEARAAELSKMLGLDGFLSHKHMSTKAGSHDPIKQLQDYSAEKNDAKFEWLDAVKSNPGPYLARVGQTFVQKQGYFQTGYNWQMCKTKGTDCITPCASFDYIGTMINNNVDKAGDRVMIRVEMGEWVDYFRPVKGSNLCNMMNSGSKHEWAPHPEGPWYKVEGARYGYGGSKDWAPIQLTFADWRAHPAQWVRGWNQKGGYGYSKVLHKKVSEWGKIYWEQSVKAKSGEPYSISVRYTTRIDEVQTLPKWTDPTTKINWDVYAQVGDVTKLKEGSPYTKGWNTQYKHKNLHSQWIEDCKIYDKSDDKVMVWMRLGKAQWDSKLEKTVWMNDGTNGQDAPYSIYYRPKAGSNMCKMLTSHDQHEFSPDGKTWFTPVYYNTHCGGSRWDYPKAFPSTWPSKKAKVPHLPFWCGSEGAYGKYTVTPSGGAGWRKAFQLLVAPLTATRASEYPASGKLQPKEMVRTFLTSARFDIKPSTVTWKKYSIDMAIIQGEPDEVSNPPPKTWKPWALKPKKGDAITATAAGTMVPAGAKWEQTNNMFIPALWGNKNPKEDNWVRYFSICVKFTTSSPVLSTLNYDDQVKMWYAGAPVFRGTQYKKIQNAKFIAKVKTGTWAPLIIKLSDRTGNAGLEMAFAQETSWQLNCP